MYQQFKQMTNKLKLFINNVIYVINSSLSKLNVSLRKLLHIISPKHILYSALLAFTACLIMVFYYLCVIFRPIKLCLFYISNWFKNWFINIQWVNRLYLKYLHFKYLVLYYRFRYFNARLISIYKIQILFSVLIIAILLIFFVIITVCIFIIIIQLIINIIQNYKCKLNPRDKNKSRSFFTFNLPFIPSLFPKLCYAGNSDLNNTELIPEYKTYRVQDTCQPGWIPDFIEYAILLVKFLVSILLDLIYSILYICYIIECIINFLFKLFVTIVVIIVMLIFKVIVKTYIFINNKFNN